MIFSASGWLFKKKSLRMHGNVNIKWTSFIRFISQPIEHGAGPSSQLQPLVDCHVLKNDCAPVSY